MMSRSDRNAPEHRAGAQSGRQEQCSRARHGHYVTFQKVSAPCCVCGARVNCAGRDSGAGKIERKLYFLGCALLSPCVRSYASRHISLYFDSFKMPRKSIRMGLSRRPTGGRREPRDRQEGDTSMNSLPAVGPHGDNRHTLLIVDDDREIRSLLAEQLEKAGYTVHTAADGAGM